MNVDRFVLFSVFFCFLINYSFLSAQSTSPYQLNAKKDIPLTGIGLGSLISGIVIIKDIEPYSFGNSDLVFHRSSIDAIDRSATRNWSPAFNKASDVLLYGSLLMPLSLGLDKEIRADFLKISTLLSQTFLLTQGATGLTKGLVKRNRPFVYNPDVPTSEKEKLTARLSFFSGHTATVSSYAFFAAKVWSDYHPTSKWKPLVWTVAASLPAATGYFRYKAGKHYPTDVITGYIVGAAIGYLVPHLHKKKRNKRYTLGSSMDSRGVQLVYRQQF